MGKNRLIIENSSLNWDAKRRYKVNSIVSYLGNTYQNLTGINSVPGVGSDWINTDSNYYDVNSNVDSISDLRLINSPLDGQVITLNGYYIKGDKRPVNYVWDIGSTATDNGGSIIKITDITTGRWVASFGTDVTIKDYGAKVDAVTDDTLSIQSMINDIGYFRLPTGTTVITDTLIIPSSTFLGSNYEGEGMGKSIINCVGMSGKKGISSHASAVYVRLTMSNFRVIGDSDTAISLTPSGQAYQCKFENLYLSSSANSAFIASPHFSCSWYNIHTDSISGHGFDLQGGNSTLLLNCYAHNSGTGKAGYRIKGNATLISCNGLDSGDIWGWFGSNTTDDGVNTIAKVTMIGCNIEDFQIRGLYFSYQTIGTFINCSYVPKTTGTYEEEIKLISSSHVLSFKGCSITSKGSTRNSTSSVVTLTNMNSFDSNSSSFDSYYSTSSALKYTMPLNSLVNQAFGIYTQKIPYVTFDRNYGFNLQIPATWTADAVTFVATGLTKIKTANTVSTTITNATGGIEGQELYIEIKDNFTTISHLSAGTGRFRLLKGSSLLATNGDVYHFVYDGTIWVEVGSRPYKLYTALLTQTGTSAPVATVLENTLGGTVVWTRTGVGDYLATLNSAFTIGKTISFQGGNLSSFSTLMRVLANNNVNNVQVITNSGSSASDAILNQSSIEIRVYS